LIKKPTAILWYHWWSILLHWLDDYGSEIKQKVVVNNECVNPNTVKAGVSQGSVLDHFFFYST
jgi:hypothetical protein